MMSDNNKEIVKRVVEALNNLDFDALSNVMAQDIVDALKQSSIPKAFPDMKLTILDQIAEGDKVAMRGKMTGTHQGEYMGAAPTGKQCYYTYIAIDRIEDGKVVESWLEWDKSDLMRQVGALK